MTESTAWGEEWTWELLMGELCIAPDRRQMLERMRRNPHLGRTYALTRAVSIAKVVKRVAAMREGRLSDDDWPWAVPS